MDSTPQSSHVWKAAAFDHFQRWADHYDRDAIHTLLFKPSYRRVMEQLRQWRRRGLENKRILDIGCGTGTLAIEYLPKLAGVEIIAGLDMSDKMIANAMAKRQSMGLQHRVNFVTGDAEHLPFEDNQFDVITCCNSFHHYPHQHHAVGEMHRVLKPNGRVIIIDGSRDDLFGYFVFEICVARAEKHVHHCTAERFRMLLENAAFQSVYQNVFGLCPPVLLNVGYAGK